MAVPFPSLQVRILPFSTSQNLESTHNTLTHRTYDIYVYYFKERNEVTKLIYKETSYNYFNNNQKYIPTVKTFFVSIDK